jgi:hypothetical protein
MTSVRLLNSRKYDISIYIAYLIKLSVSRCSSGSDWFPTATTVGLLSYTQIPLFATTSRQALNSSSLRPSGYRVPREKTTGA